MLSQFLPKYGPNRAIFNKYTDFFLELQNCNICFEYYSSSWHISIKISKKIQGGWNERVKFDQIPVLKFGPQNLETFFSCTKEAIALPFIIEYRKV